MVVQGEHETPAALAVGVLPQLKKTTSPSCYSGDRHLSHGAWHACAVSLINFILRPIERIRPWGRPERPTLSWFSLSDGWYWFILGGQVSAIWSGRVSTGGMALVAASCRLGILYPHHPCGHHSREPHGRGAAPRPHQDRSTKLKSTGWAHSERASGIIERSASSTG